MEKELQETSSGLTGVASSKPESIEQLVTAWYPGIVRYLYRMTDSLEAAEDLAQDTFVRVYRNVEKLPGIENRRAWIYRIATNTALQYRRRKRILSFIHFERMSDPDAAVPRPDTEDHSDEIDIREALQRTPEQQRTCLILHYVEGFKYREIAETLGISEEAVRKRIARGKETFQKNYNGGAER